MCGLWVYSTTAITAITAQNTLGVQRVEALPADLVAAQMRSVLTDIGADVIKIGMLANREIIKTVAGVITELAEDIPVVLDPVLVSTSGDDLLETSGVEALKEHLLPLADLVTPNSIEAGVLTGLQVVETADLITAGEALLKMGAYAALVKGGHIEGKNIVDILATHEGTHMMSAPRIHSRHTHGTGCTLASAVAALTARGMPVEQAVQEAREFVFEAIKNAPKLGKGNGPLNHGLDMGEEETPRQDKENPFAALKDLKT